MKNGGAVDKPEAAGGRLTRRDFLQAAGTLAAAGAAVWLLPEARAQDQPGGPRSPRGRDLPPCFHTQVPAHPYDVILGRPTDRAVTASVLSYAGAEAYLERGTGSGRYPQQTPAVTLPAGQPTEIPLRGLAPNTPYFYRLRTRAGGGDFAAGQEYRFRTQRPPGAAFTFTLQADSHLDERCDPALYAVALRNAAADAPDFHVDLGDTFMGDKVRALGLPLVSMHLAQRYYFGLLCPSAPLFFVTGNHDDEIAGADPEAVALRRQYLPNPVPETAGSGNYYAWEWGDALFIVLDPFTCMLGRIRTPADNWNRTLGEAQYRWLQRTLAGSRAAYKFVFIHNLVGGLDKDGRGGIEAAPYFEWGGRYLDGSDHFAAQRPGWELPIHQLLVSHGVAAVFHGHDHFYDRQELDGIVYQEAPQPGWVGGEWPRQAADYGYTSGRILASSGHLRVRVTPQEATVEYVRSRLPEQEAAGLPNAAVADSYRLAPALGAKPT